MALARPLGGVVQKPSARGRLHRRGGKSRRPLLPPCGRGQSAVLRPNNTDHPRGLATRRRAKTSVVQRPSARAVPCNPAAGIGLAHRSGGIA